MGGLACAHELARTGLSVTVFEASATLGGKARSHYLPGTGTEGRRDLPGEHGFRFYPAFYRHTIATMTQIHLIRRARPAPSGREPGRGAGGRGGGERAGNRRHPAQARTARDVWRAITGIYRVGGSAAIRGGTSGAHLKYLTACERAWRDSEIEAQSWARFIGADRPDAYGDAFREVLLACTRTMVAMDAERGQPDGGQTSSLLILATGSGQRRRPDDDGTDDECWMYPWQAQLRALGGGRSSSTWLDGPPAHVRRRDSALAGPDAPTASPPSWPTRSCWRCRWRLRPGWSAAPDGGGRASLKRARPAGHLHDRDERLDGRRAVLSREDLPLCEGHLSSSRSPWSLTAISQGSSGTAGARGMSTLRRRPPARDHVGRRLGCFTPDRDGMRRSTRRCREGILRRVPGSCWMRSMIPPPRGSARLMYAAHLDDEVKIGRRRHQHRPPAGPPAWVVARASDRDAADRQPVPGGRLRPDLGRPREHGRRRRSGPPRRCGGASRLRPRRQSRQAFRLRGSNRFASLKAIDQRLHRAGLPHLFNLGDLVAARLPRPLRDPACVRDAPRRGLGLGRAAAVSRCASSNSTPFTRWWDAA